MTDSNPATGPVTTNPVRSVVAIFSTGLSISAVGLGMVLANWHPRIGVVLMIAGAAYLLWELLTSEPIAKVIPGMLRLLAGVMIAAFTLLVVGPDIETTLNSHYVKPDSPATTAKGDNPLPPAKTPPISKKTGTPPPIIQEVAPPTRIDQTRVEAISLIRKMDEAWSTFANDYSFWSEPQNFDPWQLENAKKRIGTKYRNDFHSKAVDIKDRLVGNIHGVLPQLPGTQPGAPSTETREELYNPTIYPDGSMSAYLFREQVLDLKQLLNTVEAENNLQLSCQKVDPQMQQRVCP